MSFKFGDIVRNDWAGDINPHREGMFLYYVTRDSGPFSTTRFAVLARDGKKWEHDASDEKLVVTGNVFDDLSGLREENERLRDKIKELEKLASDLIIQATCAEEKGAGSMLEHVITPLKIYATPDRQETWANNYKDVTMQLWREGRK